MKSIEVTDLVKTYNKGKTQALNGVSFSVESGELFGLIGPDGAGKTTIFRLLTTLLLPDSGSASVMGYDIVKDYRKIRRSVGYMPGRFSLYHDLTVEENLRFYAALFNTTIDENYHLIEDIYKQIEPFRKRRAGALSGGMKQKLALSCALIHKPRVLFLDEPTTGIDPVSRVELWDMLQKLKAENISILASTPYMDEALRCDRIALIQNGNIMDVDTPANILDSFSHPLLAVKADNMFKLLRALESHDEVESSYAFGESAHAVYAGDPVELTSYLNAAGLQDVSVAVAEPTIEDAFIALSLDVERGNS